MMLKIKKFVLCFAVMLTCMVGSQKSAMALMFNQFEANDHTYYAVISNSIYNKVVITQFLASPGAAVSQTLTTPVLEAFVSTPVSMYTVTGQTSIIGSGSIASFDPTGAGTINFTGGPVVNSGSFNIFTGIPTVNLPPAVGSYPTPFNVYGFNIAPGGNPTIDLAAYAPPPSDGIVLGLNQSIVFRIPTPPNTARTFGMGAFAFNENDQAILASAKVDSYPGYRESTVPEPASMLLLGSGLFGAIGLRRKKS